MAAPLLAYRSTRLAAVFWGWSSAPGRVKPSARMPPVEVPAITSKSFAIGVWVGSSIRARTLAGICP
jgi:hypothetical protein